MARREALLRLHKTLLSRGAALRRILADELGQLRDFKAADSTGDSADLAFDASSDEMSTRLAELDARELTQIERALAALKQGTYGICAGDSANCQKKIPVARLNVLPCTPFCISCEREMEKSPNWQDQRSTGNWDLIAEAQAPMQDKQINLSELELDLSGNRHG